MFDSSSSPSGLLERLVRLFSEGEFKANSVDLQPAADRHYIKVTGHIDVDRAPAEADAQSARGTVGARSR